MSEIDELAEEFKRPFYMGVQNPATVERTFTTQELCKMFNCEAQQLRGVANKKGFMTQEHKLNQWTYSEYLGLKAWYEEQKEAEMYKDYPCTKQVADMLGTIPQYVTQVQHILNIDLKKVYSGHGPRYCFTPEAIEQIKNYMEKTRQKKLERKAEKEAEKEAAIKELEAMKEQHPLVTDTRCFDPNYWPETVPLCFMDTDNEVID